MASAALQLDTPIHYIKGVGPVRSQVLAEIGINTVEDLLYYFPRRHLDRTSVTACRDLEKGNVVTIVGQIKSTGVKTFKRGKLFQVLLEDEFGHITLTWFNGIRYVQKSLKVGSVIAAHGKVEYYRGFQITHPEYDMLDQNRDQISTGSVIPLYPLNQNLKKVRLEHRSLRKFIRDIHSKINIIDDFSPDSFLKDYGLVDRKQALTAIHFAEDVEQLHAAKRRLKFDEHFFLQLGVASKKKAIDKIGTTPLAKTGRHTKDIYSQLDFELTASQKRVINEISEDIKKSVMMNRLLQGDVGSGKTIVAILAAALAVDNDVQVAIMAPTEILAEQHYTVFRKFTDRARIPTALLVGNLRAKARESILNGLGSGKIKIIIGTHALIQKDVQFQKLGLVIVDEQHRFGVLQRGDLVDKGQNPHFLAMTATPIPRTLSITYYGDMDLSIIGELPKERIPVTTTVVKPDRLDRVYNFVKEEVIAGRQCMIVYPLVEETEKSDLAAATEAHKHLSTVKFPNLKVGLIHGRMKNDEKDSIMAAFAANEINILISTTVIEVGIDVPNTTVMIIEHAERFGLTQLHQLRGRVGRSNQKSYCIMVERNFTENSQRRLEIMESTNDGFKIADEDLKMRGPGVFFGIQQSGFFKFKIANLLTDGEIIRSAREAAFELIANDQNLELSDNQPIKYHFNKHYRHILKGSNIG